MKNCRTVVEQVTGRDHVLNHLSIPAACFTHPEISMVGLTEVYHIFLLVDVLSSACCLFHSFMHVVNFPFLHFLHWHPFNLQ